MGKWKTASARDDFCPALNACTVLAPCENMFSPWYCSGLFSSWDGCGKRNNSYFYL